MNENPTKLELAYLAGVMDCDGYISIIRVKNKRYPNTHQYNTIAGVGQTHRGAVDLFHKYWGGGIYIRKREEKEAANWRPMFYWNVSSKKAKCFIETILPFMRVKKRQAEIFIVFRESLEMPRDKSRIEGSHKLRPEVIDHRDLLIAEIRGLNANRKSSDRRCDADNG